MNENNDAESSCSTSADAINQSAFYFKKHSNKKRSRSDMLFDRLNYSMNSFMKAQSQADNEFLSNLLEQKEKPEDEEVVVRVRAKGDSFCIEMELDMTISHIKFIDLIKSEFNLLDSQELVVTKLPDIWVRNDRDVKRLKNGDQLEFYIVNNQST